MPYFFAFMLIPLLSHTWVNISVQFSQTHISKTDSVPVSEINLPVSINLKPLIQLADKNVDTFFTSPNYPDGWITEGCATRYQYTFRRGPLQVSGAGNTISFGFTAFYKIAGSTRICINGNPISPWTPPCRCGFNEPERKVKVSFLCAFRIDPDYSLKMFFKANEPEPLDKCEVCFWGQDITKQVMKGLSAELESARKEMEKKYGTVPLHSYFSNVWKHLTKLYAVPQAGWLQINPIVLRINRLFIQKDSLHVHFGLSAKPEITFEKPPEKNTPLPPLGKFSNQQGFSVIINAALSYDSLSQILNRQLAGQSFEFKKGIIKKQFVIDSCRLSGSGNEKLKLFIRFSGTNKGSAELEAKPHYDENGRILELKQVDVDIRSKNILLGSADWLFDKKITREITRKALIELGPYFDSASNIIQSYLNGEMTKGVHSEGTVKEIKLYEIIPASQQLVIRSLLKGNMYIRMNAADIRL
ncbi:MAG: DUF4403 family protein [Chitinophagaceae bacterium]|nr:DUF4403 family protein [Chitinophagaceae bacterium]